MKRLALALVLPLLLAAPCLAAQKAYVVFEATVMRIEPWGPVRIACGVYANYRLAEYKVEVPYEGQPAKGSKLVIEHLACNYNELDDLKVGDKVLVVAEVLPKPDKFTWKRSPQQSTPTDESIAVEYRGLSVGKLVYPTSAWPR